MNAKEHRIDGRIRYRYPTPIASPYRFSRIARTPVVRLGHVLGTIDQTVRFLCWLLLADYLAHTDIDQRNDEVEKQLLKLPTFNTLQAMELLKALVSAANRESCFVPEILNAMESSPGQRLEALVKQMGHIIIERSSLDMDAAGARADELQPEIVSVLGDLSILEKLMIVRPESVTAESDRQWYMHPWRGVGNCRPLLVQGDSALDLGIGATMLIRVGKSEGLRLDPFLVAGGNGRLLMLINAPEMKTGRYGHYAGGGLVEWDLELSEFLEQRHLRAGKVSFELDIASTKRLGREIEGVGNENPEYSDLIPTIVDELGWHYRAHHDATRTLHNVLALHDHLCRDGQYVRHLLHVMRTLGDIEHPNVIPPKVSIFDPLAGSYLLGSEYASHGRLSDRMPAGAQLPVRWAVAMADAILAGLDAIAEHDIYLSNLPAYAIGISKDGAAQIVPSLLAHEGKAEDGPKAVAVLLYQMLTGEAPKESNSLPPALVRKAIPESVSDVVLRALDGRYSNVVTLRADLRMVQGDIGEESPEAITGSAVQRTYGFLEKLTGSTLVRLEASALKCEEDENWDGLIAVLHAIIDSLWDPDTRLDWIRRLVTIVAGQSARREEMVRVFERAIEIAGDHLPTLEFVAAHYKDAIRGSDRDRLFKRILHAAVDGDDLARALSGLALLNESRRELEAAKDYWQQLIAIRSDDEEAWLGLCRIHRVFGDHAALAAGLERLLDKVNDADKRLDLVRELAVLRAGPLQDPLSAISLLREVVSNADSGLGAWQVLGDIARDINDDDLLIEALSGMAAHGDVGVDESYVLRLEQAVIMGLRLDDANKSIALLDILLVERPGDTTALSYKALILERTGRWLDAATALENWAAVEEQSWSLSRALRRLAYITGVHLADEERAQQLYEGVLEAEPDNREALDFLEKSYTSSKDWPALSGVLATLSDSVSRRSERVSLLHRLAELRFNELDDKQGAFHAYGKLLNEAPRDEGALEIYVSLADELGGWDQAQAVVEAVLPHLDREKARTLRRQLGQLRLDQDQDITAVVEYFRTAVADDPDDVASLEGLVGALERVGAWEEVAETIEQLVGMAQVGEIRSSRLLQLAYCLRDRVLSPKRAVVALDRVLKIDRENPDALRALAALGEAAGRTPEAQGLTLKLWSEHCTDPMERVDVLEALAKMADYVLSESECVNVYNQILELDAANPTALQGLEHHFARLEDWENVAQVVSQQIDAAPAATRTRLELHLAEIYLDCLGDCSAAETVLTGLLERDTGDPIAIELLSRSYEMSGQTERLVDLLRGQADEAISEGRRADLLHRLGCVSAEHLDDEQAAVVFMERALAQNAEHLASLRFLADFYLRDEQWVEARPVLETLVSVLEEPSSDTIRTTQSGLVADPAGLILLWNQLGAVLTELAEPEKAHLYFNKVTELQPQNMSAQQGIARLSWLSRDYDNAQSQYRTILDLHGKTLNEKEHATIRSHLGEIAAERGDVQHSRELLENALEMDSSNLSTVRELVSTCQKQEDWEAVVKYQSQLSKMLDAPLERFAVMVDQAQVYREKLNQFDDARKVLEEARVLKPNSQGVPVQLLEVYLELERYKDAADILLDLVSREKDPKRKATYTYTLAIIYRDNIHDARKAVSFINDTLDLDPGRLEAFEALDRILVERKDWQGQAESYRNMIGRIQNSGQDGLEFRLRKNLAQIYHTVLNQPENELEELAAAVSIKPGDLEVHGMFARALEQQDPTGEGALREHRRILTVDPNALVSWKALSRIYTAKENVDAAWCACGVLMLLDNADESEHAFYMRHQQPALALKRGMSGISQWEDFLYSSRQNVLLSRIFKILGQGLGDALGSRKLEELGLTAQDAVSLTQKSRFSSFLTTVSKVLGVPVPTVYRDPNGRGLRKEALVSPTLVVGPDVLTGRKGKELRFVLGKAMSYFLPAHWLAGMYPAGHLRTLLIAGMSSVMPEFTQGGEPGVKGIQKQLEVNMSADDRTELRELVLELTEQAQSPNLNEWLRQVELTANNAGHLLCNDIEVSVRMLKEEREAGQSWSKLSLKDAISELALYTVSQPFLTLRKELGAAITE